MACLAALALPATAFGWIETRIESVVTGIDVARDGTAVVSHEIALRIRGGPLERYVIPGVDADAEPLPDASIVPAAPGMPASSVVPLLVRVDEAGTMVIEPDHPKGVRRGSYVLRVAYRTNLFARGLLALEGGTASLRWNGPRFDDGIDSAKVVFKTSRAPNPPRLPEATRQERLGIDSDFDGVFLSSLRRAHDGDELDVVRPHVAKGEPVAWRVVVDPKAFDVFAAPAPVAAPAVGTLGTPGSQGPRARGALLVGLFAAALAFALLVAGKSLRVARAAAAAGAEPRPVIPLPVALRSTLAGIALVGGLGVGWATDWPLAAGALVMLAMALAAHRLPVPSPGVRGPGEWRVLPDGEVLAREARSARRVPASWLDAGSARGAAVVVTLVAAAALVAHRWSAESPYHAVLVLLAAAAFVPVFCTGRASQLPADPVIAPRAAFAWLARALRRDRRLAVSAICRFPVGRPDPDELRLRVQALHALDGFVGIEIAYEYPVGWAGPLPLPCVLVRVADGSPAYRALPRSVVWTRGRRPDERVALIRPKVPGRSFVLALVRRLVAVLSKAPAAASASPGPRRAPRSASVSPPRARRSTAVESDRRAA